MKFTDGYWLLREGVTAAHPAAVLDVTEADGGGSVVRLCDGAGAEHVVVEVSRTGAELRGVVTRGLEHLADG
jgi:hypothetical protein